MRRRLLTMACILVVGGCVSPPAEKEAEPASQMKPLRQAPVDRAYMTRLQGLLDPPRQARDPVAVAPREPVAEGSPSPCETAFSTTAQTLEIPGGLLEAIARVRSRGAPSPWAVRITASEGRSEVFRAATRDQARSVVASAMSAGVSDVSLGCMLLSWKRHGGRIGVDAALEAESNVTYFGRYFVGLFEETGSWTEAVALAYSRRETMAREAHVCRVTETLKALRGKDGPMSDWCRGLIEGDRESRS